MKLNLNPESCGYRNCIGGIPQVTSQTAAQDTPAYSCMGIPLPGTRPQGVPLALGEALTAEQLDAKLMEQVQARLFVTDAQCRHAIARGAGLRDPGVAAELALDSGRPVLATALYANRNPAKLSEREWSMAIEAQIMLDPRAAVSVANEALVTLAEKARTGDARLAAAKACLAAGFVDEAEKHLAAATQGHPLDRKMLHMMIASAQGRPIEMAFATLSRGLHESGNKVTSRASRMAEACAYAGLPEFAKYWLYIASNERTCDWEVVYPLLSPLGFPRLRDRASAGLVGLARAIREDLGVAGPVLRDAPADGKEADPTGHAMAVQAPGV